MDKIEKEDIDNPFISRHCAYWSTILCIKKELECDSSPTKNNDLCDYLGVEDRYIHNILSKLRNALTDE
jgi:hypothetical protein